MRLFIILLCLSVSTSAFAKKPRFTLSTKSLIGHYSAIKDANCIDGVDICEEASILKEEGKLVIHFGGEYSDKTLELKKTKSGVLVFSESNYNDDCDDAGCANTIKISGVVYPKKIKGKYIPQIKARIELECGHSDWDGGCDEDKEYKYTIRMRK